MGQTRTINGRIFYCTSECFKHRYHCKYRTPVTRVFQSEYLICRVFVSIPTVSDEGEIPNMNENKSATACQPELS